ncbi:hypothetical protein IF2G_01015 [Cordyceps javanica]|nr:hypothetical protein IF2G_01015 [Cordyceps javanica]
MQQHQQQQHKQLAGVTHLPSPSPACWEGTRCCLRASLNLVFFFVPCVTAHPIITGTSERHTRDVSIKRAGITASGRRWGARDGLQATSSSRGSGRRNTDSDSCNARYAYVGKEG